MEACRGIRIGYTAGQLDTDLRRIVRRLIADGRRSRDGWYPDDPDLAALRALAGIVTAAEGMIDRHITAARRRESLRLDFTIEPGRSVPWARIGEMLGLTGQAVGKRARRHHLHVTQLTPERLTRLIRQGPRLTGR
jgi:hypothetical protein